MTPGRSGKPSERERWNKINAARKLIEDGDWDAPNPGKLDNDLRELEDAFDAEWATDEDKLVLFTEALSEIRAEHYWESPMGMETSRELATADLEMWKFKWQSNKDCFGKCVMWMKFSVVGTGEKGPLWVFSLHIDRPPSQD